MSSNWACPFTASVDCRGPSSSVKASGELDLATAPHFEDALDEAARASSVVEVDLRDITYMASEGLRVLLAAQRRLSSQVVLVEPSPAVTRLLELTDLVSHFAVRQASGARMAEEE